MVQNAEAAAAQQTAAAAAAEHRAEKLDLKLADIQWELEQCQRQLKDKTAQAEQQMKVRSHAADVMNHEHRTVHIMAFGCASNTISCAVPAPCS